MWHASVLDATCESIANDESGISVSGEIAVIGDFPIEKRDAPKLHKLSLSVQIECDFDFWSDRVEIEPINKNYLGFRKHECVRLLFVFETGRRSSSNPATGDYIHSFLGVITSPCSSLEQNANPQRPTCVGPRKVGLDVVVHDDVM